MGRALFVNGPLFGHVLPTLGLVKELVKRGERVTYCCTEKFRGAIEKEGARFLSYPKGVYNELENWDLEKETKITDTEWDLAKVTWTEMILEAFKNTVAQNEYDYLVHGHSYGAGFELGQLLGIPRISLSPDFAKGRDGDAYKFDPVLALWQGLKGDPMTCIKDYFARRSLKWRFNVNPNPLSDLYFSKGDLTIVQTSRMLQPNGDEFDSSYIFTGPSINRSNDEDDTFDLLDATSPVVYISFGTIFGNVPIFKKCVDAFKDFPGTIIMSTGNKIEVSALGEIPPNFIVRKFVSQLKVLQHADVFVTHGGANSINEALYFDVPLLLVPHACDQFRNAERVCELGAGIALQSTELSNCRLVESINHLLYQSHFKEAAKSIGASLRDSGGASKAAEEILSFIRSPKMLKKSRSSPADWQLAHKQSAEKMI